MSESIVADTLVEIITYSPQDQADAGRIIRTMTAAANGVDFSRVQQHPAIRTECNLFSGVSLGSVYHRNPAGRLYGPTETYKGRSPARSRCGGVG